MSLKNTLLISIIFFNKLVFGMTAECVNVNNSEDKYTAQFNSDFTSITMNYWAGDFILPCKKNSVTEQNICERSYWDFPYLIETFTKIHSNFSHITETFTLDSKGEMQFSIESIHRMGIRQRFFLCSIIS